MTRQATRPVPRWPLLLGFGLAVGCGDTDSGGVVSTTGGASTATAGATNSAGGAAAAGSAGLEVGRSGTAGVLIAAGAGPSGAGSGGLASSVGGTGGVQFSEGGSFAKAGAGGNAAGAGHAGSGVGGASSAGSAGGGAPGHTGAWRITPLGDSITGTTCGPQLLSRQLKDKGHGNFGFFGSNLNNQSCSSAPNVQTEGHGGYLVTDLVGSGKHASELSTWSKSDQAEIVLMHFGTNDIWNNVAPSAIVSAFSTVLASFRAAKPKLVLFVAQIIPMNPSGCSACETRVKALNAQIPIWASSASTAESPIYVVDQHSVFKPEDYTPMSAFTADGVHPNQAGAQLMADKWYAALTEHGLP